MYIQLIVFFLWETTVERAGLQYNVDVDKDHQVYQGLVILNFFTGSKTLQKIGTKVTELVDEWQLFKIRYFDKMCYLNM